MEHTKEPWIDEARVIAAQCWCDETTSHIEMDGALAEAFAQRLAAWMETGSRYARNEVYYRDLIDEAAKSIGIAMYTADDQSVHLEPLRAKLPECVTELVQQRDELLAALEGIVPYIAKSSAADGGAAKYSAAVAAADVVRAAIAKVKP